MQEIRLLWNGTALFLSLYCQKESTSLNAARYEIYRKKNNPPLLKSLPIRLEPDITRAESPFTNVAMEGADKSDPPDVQLTDHG